MHDTIVDFVAYLTDVKHYSSHTASAYETDIRDFVTFFNEYNGTVCAPTDLALADTLCFRAWLASRQRRSLSAKSTARALSSLRGFYRFLNKNNNIKNEAISLISAPRVPRKLSKAIEVSDVSEIHNAIRETESDNPWIAARDWALVVLIFGCGLRISEALSITHADINHHPDCLRIVGKGNKERIVPVLPAVWDAMDKYLAICPFDRDVASPVFRSVRGLPMSPRMAQKVIEHLRNYLQLPDYVTPHALRHTFASVLLAGGADLRSLQELLGHSSLSTTQLYTKVNMADIMSAYENAHPLGHS
ncbi:MAG: tyrosine recombinase XerC [Alphaproteobacteria bacterium]|nr:tyrosine recombinase XerC [Alphaproteobacteria bacterium]